MKLRVKMPSLLSKAILLVTLLHLLDGGQALDIESVGEKIMKKLGKQEKSRDPFSCHWQIKRSDFPNCRCWPSYRQINIKSFNKWSSQSPQSLVTRHNDRRTESCLTNVSDVISLKLSPSQPVLLKRVSYEVTITLLSLSSTSLCISFFDVFSLL